MSDFTVLVGGTKEKERCHVQNPTEKKSIPNLCNQYKVFWKY